MLEEFRRSISAILHERVTSPLYGTFLFSWLVVNWKIPYITFFVDSNEIAGNKMAYISTYLLEWWNVLLLPLIYTAILLVLVPFAANGAFWLDSRFKQWRIKKKQELEKGQLLSYEQSLALRNEMTGLKESIGRDLSKRDEKIKTLEDANKQLAEENDSLKQQKEDALAAAKHADDEIPPTDEEVTDNALEESQETKPMATGAAFSAVQLAKAISAREELRAAFKYLYPYILREIFPDNGYDDGGYDNTAIVFCISNGLVEERSVKNNRGSGFVRGYVFTAKGKDVANILVNNPAMLAPKSDDAPMWPPE